MKYFSSFLLNLPLRDTRRRLNRNRLASSVGFFVTEGNGNGYPMAPAQGQFVDPPPPQQPAYAPVPPVHAPPPPPEGRERDGGRDRDRDSRRRRSPSPRRDRDRDSRWVAFGAVISGACGDGAGTSCVCGWCARDAQWTYRPIPRIKACRSFVVAFFVPQQKK